MPFICPLCGTDVEHMPHMFFYCNFVTHCWQLVGLQFDMMEMESASNWLHFELETDTHGNLTKFVVVL